MQRTQAPVYILAFHKTTSQIIGIMFGVVFYGGLLQTFTHIDWLSLWIIVCKSHRHERTYHSEQVSQAHASGISTQCRTANSLHNYLSNCNIFGFADTVALFANEARLFQI